MTKKAKKTKLKWANDEFDDFRSAGSDSDDKNYKPGLQAKPAKKAISKEQ